MSKKIFSQKRFQGISDSLKESAAGQIEDAYYFGRAVNYRDDPQSITLLPSSVKESGAVVTDLLKWADLVPVTLKSFFYGNTGNLYQRTSAASWSNIHTVASSHGNGLAYFSGDDYIYYTGDSALGRYGPTQGSTPTFSDNFLKAQGGVPQNTASILLASASSMYGHAADSASLEITSDLTLETYFKANSFPTTGNSMTLVGKWDESGATRGYKMDLYGVSGFFGAGVDGSLTISSNTTDAPIDSTASGTAGASTLSATNVGFDAGDTILIIQMQGTNAGQWERNTIQGYTAGTITLGTALRGTYSIAGSNTAQVLVVKEYTSVTVNVSTQWTAKTWTGSVGGILTFLCSGTFTNNGTISADTIGFRGSGVTYDGEGSNSGTTSLTGNTGGSGGGGGLGSLANHNSHGGAGGGNGVAGANDQSGVSIGGIIVSSTDLTTMEMGGGGGGAGYVGGAGTGGNGGGIIFSNAVTWINNGTITANGQVGSNGTSTVEAYGGGGGGAGGAILSKSQTYSNTGTITAKGAAGGTGGLGGSVGGAGGNGRVVNNYLTSQANTGTITPAANNIQDNTLVTTTTIQARLGISNDGTAFEYLTQNLMSIATGIWNRLSITWKASTSTATFYLNAASIGTSVGAKTSISSNAALLTVGANNSGAGIGNYFDGLLNDMRIWNNVQTAGQIFANNQLQINAASAGLQAYYKFNSAATDATTNTNNLTLVNTPTYSVDVPFPAPTTRLDIDTKNTNTGQTYTLLTSISESATDKLTFTPVNDPQASVAFYVNTAGTGNWTVTVHDPQNNVIATQTILNASVPSGGAIEFIFATPWRKLSTIQYHMHLTVSTGTSKVVTGTTADFSTAEYTAYFGFLVTDTQFHPIIQFQYQPLGGVLTGAMIVGNERYVAVWDGATWSPNFISFPPAWRVRCFAFWREYLAIGMWRGGNIYDFDRGRIYFWDGIAPTFNFFIDVPEGQINAMVGVNTNLFIFAGYRGYLLNYQGSYFFDTGNSNSNKLKRMPLISSTDYVEVAPGAFNMWRGLLHFGLYYNSNSTTVQRGTYSFGTFNQYYPATLSYDYVISTGNNGNTVSIGLVYPIGQSLIVGWQDGISYGADNVNFTNNPAASGEIQLLVQDDNASWKEKANFEVRADFLALNSGESVDTKIKIDRAATFTTSTADTTVGDTFTKLNVGAGRGHEYQIGVDLFSTGTTSPTLRGISLMRDDLDSEDQF